MSNSLLSLPAVAGEDSLLAKTFGVRSLDATPIFTHAPALGFRHHRFQSIALRFKKTAIFFATATPPLRSSRKIPPKNHDPNLQTLTHTINRAS